jgi:nicotinate-nucleotide adenylyltransferase
MKLGIFGGTFNPPHFGHLRTAEEVRDAACLDMVIFMPSGNPPMKTSGLAEAAHRYEMVRRAVLNNKGFTVSDMEVRQSEISYTVTTLLSLREQYPEDELFFILGMDAFLDMPNWRQPERLVELSDFIVVTRPGVQPEEMAMSPFVAPHSRSAQADPDKYTLVSGRRAALVRVTPLDISSTAVRTMVGQGKSIRYLLPEAVEEYIHEHRLYYTPSSA